MKPGRGKYILALCLAILMVLNSAAGAVSAAVATNRADGKFAGEAKTGFIGDGVIQKTGAFFGSTFSRSGSASSANSLEEELSEAAETGLFDPLLGTLGEFLAELMEDEELKEVLGLVLDDIMADERIAGYDTDALVVRTLRDDRLALILGDVIARHLGDEKLLFFVDQLTLDLQNLLRDPAFVSFFNDALIALLNDEGVNELVFEIAGLLLKYADALLGNLGDGRVEQALSGIIDDALAPFEKVVAKYSDEIIDDPRFLKAMDKIITRLDGIDDEYINALKEDPEINASIESLKGLFTGPLEDLQEELPEAILENIREEGALDYMLDVLLNELLDKENYEEVFNLVEVLQTDLSAAFEQIGGEAGAAVTHYTDSAEASEPEGGGGCTDLKPEEKKKLEDEAARFLNHWSDTAGWVVAQVMADGDLDELLDQYMGEDSQHLARLFDALDVALETAQGELLDTVDTVVDDSFDGLRTEIEQLKELLDEEGSGAAGGEPGPGELLAEYALLRLKQNMQEEAFDEQLEEAIDEAILSAPLEELLAELKGEGDRVIEVLKALLESMPLEELLAEVRGELVPDDENEASISLSDLLHDIVVELPFDVLADLLTRGDVEEIVSGLLSLTEGLPLDTVTPYLRANADELGHTIARSLLNGIADSIEYPEPEDPRIEAVMALLKNEERLRRFYLDLGGSDPDSITAESSTGEIILAILLEIAGDEARIERFMEDLEQRSEPAVEELLNYGAMFGERLLGGLRSFARPFVQRALSSLFFFVPRDFIEEGDPVQWLSYERFKSEAGVAGMLISEVLTESRVPEFIDESIYSFLVEHDAIKDFATADRFSVISHFMAEMADAEPVKEILAGDNAYRLIDLAEESLGGLFGALSGLVKPGEIMPAVNALLAGFLPGEKGDVYEVSLKTFSLSPQGVLQEATGGLELEKKVPWLTGKIGEQVKPLGKIPGLLLGDVAGEGAVKEITATIPGSAIGVAARVLEDEWLNDFVEESLEEILDEILEEGLDAAVDILEDKRIEEALEEALVTVLADSEISAAAGDFVGDLLTDPALRTVLRKILDNSRKVAIDYSKYNGPSASYIQDPGPHDYVGRSDLHEPLPAPFDFKEIKISAPFPVSSVTAPAHFYLLAGNNAIYAFTVELLDWLNPGSSFPKTAPGEYLRDFLTHHYLEESWVRAEIAKPLAGMAARSVGSIAGEREAIKELLKKNLLEIPDGVPLKLGQYLRTDPKPAGLLAGLFDLPLAEMAQLLENNADIEDLLYDDLYLQMAGTGEELADYVDSGERLRALLGSASVEVNLDPLRPLLMIDRDLPQVVLDRLSSFPIEMVRGFLNDDNRAYRLGYMIEDLPARFTSDLLTDPALIRLESELVNEKVEGADYTLAASIFSTVEKFVASEPLGDFGGEKVFTFLSNLYEKIRAFFSSLFNLNNSSNSEAAARQGFDAMPAGPGCL